MKIDKIISSHTLRHIYAKQYYKQTKDIETLRRISGHLDINLITTYITLTNIDVENGIKFFLMILISSIINYNIGYLVLYRQNTLHNISI